MTVLYVGYPPEHGCRCPSGSVMVFVYCDPAAATIAFAFDPAAGIAPSLEIKKAVPIPYNRLFLVNGLPVNQELRMTVTATDAGGNSATVVRMLTTHKTGLVAARPAAGKKGSIVRDNLTISNPLQAMDPTNPAQVEQTFPVCGYVNPTTTAVNAWVEDSNGNITTAVAVVPPPAPYNWAFTITLPAQGAEYTLVVEAGDGGQSNTAIGFVTSPLPPAAPGRGKK